MVYEWNEMDGNLTKLTKKKTSLILWMSQKPEPQTAFELMTE